jgi:hypothetical protein
MFRGVIEGSIGGGEGYQSHKITVADSEIITSAELDCFLPIYREGI